MEKNMEEQKMKVKKLATAGLVCLGLGALLYFTVSKLFGLPVVGVGVVAAIAAMVQDAKLKEERN